MGAVLQRSTASVASLLALLALKLEKIPGESQSGHGSQSVRILHFNVGFFVKI